jgi:hypothetical protein
MCHQLSSKSAGKEYAVNEAISGIWERPSADEATMLKVMESPVKLVTRRAVGALEKRKQKR